MPNHTPLIAIVGRPNVGKSTLFNRLIGKWQTIVEDRPGVTRDRLFGDCKIEGNIVQIMDTGGLQVEAKTRVEREMSKQAWKGIEQADFILFVLDGRAGVTHLDQVWIDKVRKIKKPKLFVINKLDDPNLDVKAAEFFELGVQPVLILSAEHKRNFSELYDNILDGLGLKPCFDADEYTDDDNEEEDIEIKAGEALQDLKIAISGRPNVGKSTLLNALLQEDRCIVDDVPGTTRDPVDEVVLYNEQTYRFIDCAGIRKRAKTVEKIETFSVMQALKVVDQADIVLLLIDGVVGPTEQDAHVAGYAFEKNKAIILIVNKWDEGSKKYKRDEFVEKLELKMNYLNYCPVLYVSAKNGKNLDKIFDAIECIRDQFDKKISTSELNKTFEHIIDHHPLPVFKGQQIKMFYATQAGQRPPTFLVFCNYPKNVHFSYKRYLINALREIFNYKHVPVRVVFKAR